MLVTHRGGETPESLRLSLRFDSVGHPGNQKPSMSFKDHNRFSEMGCFGNVILYSIIAGSLLGVLLALLGY